MAKIDVLEMHQYLNNALNQEYVVLFSGIKILVFFRTNPPADYAKTFE